MHWGLLSLEAAWWCSSLCHFVSQRGKSQQGRAGGDKRECVPVVSPSHGRAFASREGESLQAACWALPQLPAGLLVLKEARKVGRFLLSINITGSSQSLTSKVSLAPKIFANYCCALLLSCPFLSLRAFPPAFDSINQSLVPNLVKFQLPRYSLSDLWEMKVWKCV